MIAALFLVGLSACAVPPPAEDPDAVAEAEALNDPAEPLNRALYDVNSVINHFILGPLGMGYRYALPPPVRNGVHNALYNLAAPVRFANDLLQADPRCAVLTAERFVINSTVGVAGLVDVASAVGIPRHDNDFGITLASWGVPEGPYLYIPILTSSSPRDAIGGVVDLVIDPWSLGFSRRIIDDADWARLGLQVTDASERWLDEVRRIERTSLDPYATYRSIYQQHRHYAIANGGCGDVDLVRPGRP